jgi:GNAT superfamily N-acetyltransferase
MNLSPRITTRRITARDTLPLRHEVLRPGLPRETAIFAGDDDPGTTHWGAFDGQGRILAVATLMRSPKPQAGSSPATTGGWQVRGMASAPGVRGQGYGSAVLRAAIEHARRQCQTEGASAAHAPVWCNARVAAVPFYVAHGFATQGDEFDIPGVGPHYVMVLAARESRAHPGLA